MDDNRLAVSNLLTREETAARLRIAVVTLDAMTKAGRGPVPTRIGRRVLYRATEIEKFVEERSSVVLAPC